MRYVQSLIARLGHAKRPSGKRRRLCRTLRMESLESRQLFSTSPVAAPLATPGTSTSNMTQLAQQMISSGKLAAPSGPTYLYLNFDGWKACPYNSKNDVTAFTGKQADIDSILYRTAETFAPFNVIVEQISGNGVYSTATRASTIFIGNGLSDDFTPSAFLDYPHSGGSTSHILNSDAYDLAFVSQTFNGLSSSIDRDASIANDVAHEAGHTFGLAHVRTDGKADYPTITTNTITYQASNPPDVMSYDSNNDYFSNNAYNVTDANFNSVDSSLFPNYNGTNILMQNSFTYLQTVLGARPTTSQVGIADEGLSTPTSGTGTFNFVDPGSYAATPGDHPTAISAAGSVSGTLARVGDYAAYQLNIVNSSSWVAGQELAITPGASSTPLTLMVFDTSYHSGSVGSLVACSDIINPIAFTPIAGHSYTLVVGGWAGSTGAFNFTAAPLALYLQGMRFTFTNAAGSTTGTLVVNSQTGDAIQGTFLPGTSTTGVSVSGYLGGAINGLSSISFRMENVVTTTSGQTSATTGTVTEFSGQASLSPMTVVLSGQGTYLVTRTTTVTDASGHGTQKTSTLANFSLVKGVSARQVTSLPVTGTGAANSTLPAATASTTPTTAPAATTTAAMAGQASAAPGAATLAAPARAAAVDLVLANYGTGGSASNDNDNDKRLPLNLLATVG